MKRILFVTILSLFCMVSLVVAKPAEKCGTYTETNNSAKLKIETDRTVTQDGETYSKKSEIDIKASSIKLSNSTYNAPRVWLTALIISLANSNVKGVLFLEGNKLIIKNCTINGDLALKKSADSDDGNIDVELRGNTKVTGNVEFIGDPGVLKVGQSVKIMGKPVNVVGGKVVLINR